MRLPIMEVDLGTYGKQEINFKEYTEISSDLVEELHKGSGNYAYISSVELNLKSQLKRKNAEYESLKGVRTQEITAELVAEGKKATVKAVDAVLVSDDALLRFNEEIMVLEDQVASIGSLLKALSMRHSDIKKLVELTINGMSMGRVEINKPKRVIKEIKHKSRGRN